MSEKFDPNIEEQDDGFCGICRHCSPLTCEKCTNGNCEEFGLLHCLMLLGYCELRDSQVYYSDLCEQFEQSAKEYQAEPEGAPEDVTHDEEDDSEIFGRDWKPERDERSFKEGLDRFLTGSDY